MTRDNDNIFKLYMESAEEPRMKQDKRGNKRWKLKNNQHHRIDGPAVEYADGSKAWYQFDKLHREDGPAMELKDGSKAWYIKGELHRLDGPAMQWPEPDGRKAWYVNGKHFSDMYDWAKAALQYNGEPATDDDVEDKVVETLARDVLS